MVCANCRCLNEHGEQSWLWEDRTGDIPHCVHCGAPWPVLADSSLPGPSGPVSAVPDVVVQAYQHAQANGDEALLEQYKRSYPVLGATESKPKHHNQLLVETTQRYTKAEKNPGTIMDRTSRARDELQALQAKLERQCNLEKHITKTRTPSLGAWAS